RAGTAGLTSANNGTEALGEGALQRMERHSSVVRPQVGCPIPKRQIILANALHVGDGRIMGWRETKLFAALDRHGKPPAQPPCSPRIVPVFAGNRKCRSERSAKICAGQAAPPSQMT